MKTNFVKKAAIISCLPLSIMLATAVASMEPEDRLAEDQPLLNRIQNINETLGMKKEQGLKQLAALAAAHAGTGAAYLADYHTARYYLSTKDYSGFVTAVGKFLELKSGFESKQVNMLSTLSTLLNNADASPEIKEKAFALIMPRMGMTPACWNGVAAYLKKLPVDNAQKYDLACRCAEVAGGKNEETQFQLSGLLTLFSAQETQARKVEMYQRYLKICGESGDITAAPEQCLAQVLEWRSKSGDAAAGERLKNLKSRQASDQAASQKEAGNILAILEKGPLKEAIKAVRALQMKPRCLDNDVCLQVAASKAFGSLELSGRLELAAAMFEVMQGEKSASQIYGPLSTPDEVRYSAGYTGAPYFDMLDSYIVHCVSNPNWISSLTGFFRPRVSQFSQEMQPRLYECLTHGQEKLALNDLLAQSLLEKAVLEIDRDENATLADLETVMEK